MLFRIAMICLLLAGGYAAYKITAIRLHWGSLQTSPADFTVKNGNQSGLTIVEFLNYDCGYCKSSHLVLLDYAAQNPDVRYVVRPVPFENGYAKNAADLALAAGLQGKFWDMDLALSEYTGVVDERFFRETAALYDIDFDRMVREGGEKKVQDIAVANAQAVIDTGIKTVPAFMIGKTLYLLDKPLTLGDLIRMVQAERAK